MTSKSEPQLHQRVIDYWDRAGLSSLSSSTSQNDDDFARFDNAIENRRLAKILHELSRPGGRCLDIGAGYGRFTQTMKAYFDFVVLLEGSPRIYDTLNNLWKNDPLVRCIKSDFEGFADSEKFRALFASGVVYFYSDQALYEFLSKANAFLEDGGNLILRDFVSLPTARVMHSTYVRGANCYYRSVIDWGRIAHKCGFNLVFAERSKLPVKMLRNPWVIRLMEMFRFKSLLNERNALRFCYEDSRFQLGRVGIQTSFLVLRKK